MKRFYGILGMISLAMLFTPVVARAIRPTERVAPIVGPGEAGDDDQPGIIPGKNGDDDQPDATMPGRSHAGSMREQPSLSSRGWLRRIGDTFAKLFHSRDRVNSQP